MQVAAPPRRLFDISQDLEALEEILLESGGDISDPEVEEAIDYWLDQIGSERDQKLDNYAALITELTARAKARKEEADRLAARAKVDESAAGRLKDRLLYFFDKHGHKKIETARYRLTRCANGGRQGIELKAPVDELPGEYVVVETVRSPDADKIRERLESGVELGFATLKPRGEHMRIK